MNNYKRIRHNFIFLAALVAGISYMVPVLAHWEGPMITAWKGAGVGLLALWAGFNARDENGLIFVAMLFFYALGDVLLEVMGLEKGAVAFVIGHIIAIGFYLQNWRINPSTSQLLLTYFVSPISVLIVCLILLPNPGWWHAALYTLFVAMMAATAWASRFPRYRTGIGAMMFLISDLAIFAREGGAISPVMGTALVWPLYFVGLALIALGVVNAPKRRVLLR